MFKFLFKAGLMAAGAGLVLRAVKNLEEKRREEENLPPMPVTKPRETAPETTEPAEEQAPAQEEEAKEAQPEETAAPEKPAEEAEAAPEKAEETAEDQKEA